MTEKFRSVVNCQQLSYRIVAKIAGSSSLISWNEIYFKIESAIYISKYITNNDDYDQMFAVTKFTVKSPYSTPSFRMLLFIVFPQFLLQHMRLTKLLKQSQATKYNGAKFANPTESRLRGRN